MRRGCAHVAGLYTYPAGSGEQFLDGLNAISGMGLTVAKWYMTPNYATDYPDETWSSAPSTLTELAQTTEMAAGFGAGWHTVVLTCFTFANGTTNWWRATPTSAAFANEYTEVYNLCVHLLSTYAGKHFVIQNWEGDWAFMDSTTVTTDVDQKMVGRYAAFLGARQRAVQDARRAVQSTSTIRHAVEVNRVNDARLYAHRRRILTNLAKRIKPDVISYSAYDSTIVDQGGWKANYTAWNEATVPMFRKCLQAIKQAWPGVPIQIGEFGWPEEEAPAERTSALLQQMTFDIDAVCEEEGVESIIYWQVFDNEAGGGGPGTYRGYWFVKPDGSTSAARAAFVALGPGS